MKKIIFLCPLLLTLLNCKILDFKEKKIDLDKQTYDQLQDGIYANLKTSKGDILVKFNDKESPVTVANFVGLAEGKIENFVKTKGQPFYDGTIFHRVIKDFMIQGGDPQGNGMGGPGYKFHDEKNDLKHLGKGILSMANSGPNTNGSQFFITEIATPWLDGIHTVFGKVVKGKETIDKISNVEKDSSDRPTTDVVLERVIVFTKGDNYKGYDAEKVFNEGKSKIAENNKVYIQKKEEEEKKYLENLKLDMVTTESGLMYKITKTTDGKSPVSGNNVSVHYTGKLANGHVFDSSLARNEPIEFSVGTGRVIKGWDEGILLLKEGEEATFLIPPNLAYGENGAGGVIPPNAWLIFEVKLVSVK